MQSVDSIIVGVDYSENSNNAIREAARIARSSGASLLCLHVLDEELFDAFRFSEGFDQLEIEKIALAKLEQHVGQLTGSGHGIDCQISIGHPFEAMLKAIEARDAQLLVLGSRGLDTKEANRLGIFASRCLRKAPADVLLVRQRQNAPFQSIVVCVDFSDNSLRAAHQAAAIAKHDSARLELLHVFQTPSISAPDVGIFAPALPAMRTEDISRALAEKLDLLATEISAAAGGIEIRTHVAESSSTSRGISDRVAEIGADLAVLGTRGRTGLKLLLLGTTAEKVIHRAPCSTLAVKPQV